MVTGVFSSAEGNMLPEPLKLNTTYRMHNSGPASMRIRSIGLGHGGMYEWNRFGIRDFKEDMVIHANKTKKLELSYVLPSLSLSLYTSISFFSHSHTFFNFSLLSLFLSLNKFFLTQEKLGVFGKNYEP